MTLAADRLASDLIFLTGDAGDGKTALCARVARRLGHDEELLDITPVGKWLIVKDASEVEEDRLQALLATRLAPGADGPRLLIAINEGRLRRVMRFGVTTRPALWEQVIEPALEAWIDDEAARRLDARMRVEQGHGPQLSPPLPCAERCAVVACSSGRGPPGGRVRRAVAVAPRERAAQFSPTRSPCERRSYSRTSLTSSPALTSQVNDCPSGDFKRCWQWR